GAQRHRAARGIVSLGHGPGEARHDRRVSLVQLHSDLALYLAAQFSHQPPLPDHGRHDAVSGPPGAALPGHGSDGAKDDALHAAVFSLPPLQLFGGLDSLLDRAKPPHDRADETDEGKRRGLQTASSGPRAGPAEKKVIGPRLFFPNPLAYVHLAQSHPRTTLAPSGFRSPDRGAPRR